MYKLNYLWFLETLDNIQFRNCADKVLADFYSLIKKDYFTLSDCLNYLHSLEGDNIILEQAIIVMTEYLLEIDVKMAFVFRKEMLRIYPHIKTRPLNRRHYGF